MSTRISKVFVAFAGATMLLAGCGQDDIKPVVTDDSSLPTVACALAGSAAFAERCTIEVKREIITLTSPDGGFRRLRIVPGGVAAADGAEPAMVTAREGEIEVRLGIDRYRLPATITP